ncbi:MAG: hypothetical protein VYA51_12915 [Planctomycetota bacterium]|nr:hypothetical protein [Planctomycetota bacterium]
MIRIARERGLVSTHAPLKTDGSDRKRPVTITPAGIGYLRGMGLVSITESCA